MHASQRSEEVREPRLDGLRGLAIVLVMLYHTTHYGLARTPFEQALGVVPSIGWSGVDLFFVLSGFLITRILLRAKESPHYFGSFYARRVLRIFPLYYAVLVFFLVLVPRIPLFDAADGFWHAGAAREGVWYWLYLTNLQIARLGVWQHQTLDITWSLAIEEHFYLIWPLVVRRVSERRLLVVCAALFVGAFALRVWLVASDASPLIAYTATPARFDTLAAGALLALLARREGGLARYARLSRALLCGAALLFAALYAWIRLTGAPPAVAPGVRDWEAATVHLLSFLRDPWMQTAGYSLLCVGYAALLVVVVTAPAGAWIGRAFEWRALRRIGEVSYAMYLFHVFIALLTLSFFTPGFYPDHYVLAQLAYWAIVFGVTYGLARASWALFEAPILRLKARFSY
jgi:peptidoglycan/LPS O-acetylase OafA/YrhL